LTSVTQELLKQPNKKLDGRVRENCLFKKII
jgi:hypothetical protein